MEPFVLLDDARAAGAADAQLYRAPSRIFVARRAVDVDHALAEAEAARQAGALLAGYIAYEAGLALEPRLAPLADRLTGAAGPLVWLGAFDGPESIAADTVPDWLGCGPARIGPMEPTLSQGAYEEAFAALQEAIHAGDIYQANLTLPLSGSYSGEPLALYAALRANARAGYGGVIYDGSHWLLSFSPELFVSLKGAQARTKPMKGTRPRGTTPEADAALRRDLAESEKDRAENLMIVDLLRNDLSRVAQPGSVKVDAPFAIETYPSVHQMVSTVTATLAEGHTPADLVRALFPCGSITGAPKIRAMELLADIERDARGPYCGAIGRIAPAHGKGHGNAAFNVAIRTLRLTPEENGSGRAVLGVGGAIVADSEAQGEWREAMVKGNFVRQVSAESGANGADLIETMRFDPEKGIPLLELHLERIKASAEQLGFGFDRHAARNQIQALCFELEDPAKLRLVASRRGSIALEAGPLPDSLPEPALCVVLPMPVASEDWRLRHKSSDRGFYEDALEVARDAGAHEALFLRDDGLLTEGSWTSLFVQRGDTLITPRAELGLLPGVLRRSFIDSGRAEEGEVKLGDLAEGFFLGNALRGLMPARLIGV
ncbi:aminodeoxychorismate synthase component I [Alteriqipengyuania flavescens]|uniref:aminodeoxychorismate synthase component I n=1 Tax=Alteriqipengyuania flavescens TaxID=3053610 RepID=UPI0025B36175|nr:aminodeoxychorismate synthase component I [Alteriqipengyuania flavescens]WJY19375.1 aminodeoxychorismate synthase component I [Alteriqipengyuania flavescens]WJY25317.1 aminodeoxychorismate synthase component I [Alteriqipengyuania flavescens]